VGVARNPRVNLNIRVDLGSLVPALPLVWGFCWALRRKIEGGKGEVDKTRWGSCAHHAKPSRFGGNSDLEERLVKCSRRRRGYSSLFVDFGLRLALPYPALTAQDHRFPTKPVVSLHLLAQNGDLAHGQPAKARSSHLLSSLPLPPPERCTTTVTPAGRSAPFADALAVQGSRVSAGPGRRAGWRGPGGRAGRGGRVRRRWRGRWA
jgi:hypothetical protein